MPEELGEILKNLENIKKYNHGDLSIFNGLWKGSQDNQVYISACWSGWGKVSAARATIRIIESKVKNKKVDFLIFTGVAGSANNKSKQWDVIIANSLIQHDMDARPIFNKFEIPALKKIKMNPPEKLFSKITNILHEKKISPFGSIKTGLIATGDMFVSDSQKLDSLNMELPGLIAVEMEGGAFAQVAIQEGIEWIVLRVISDGADSNAHQDFDLFLKKYNIESWKLIECILKNL